jgi:hypothetical protein
MNATTNQRPMSGKEISERARLARLWATGRATKAQILRCMALDRKAENEATKAAA